MTTLLSFLTSLFLALGGSKTSPVAKGEKAVFLSFLLACVC